MSLSERPDLAASFDDFPDSWPEFMFHDPVSAALFDSLVAANPALNLLALDPDDPTRPLARACGFAFSCADPTRLADPVAVLDPAGMPAGGDAGVPAGLPPGGYDDVLLGGARDLLAGRRGNLAAALEVTVRPDARGSGLSGLMLRSLRARVAAAGYPALVVPVRPNRKHEHPEQPLAGYAARTRADGLPEDPWLRVHVRAGGRMVGVAPRSMSVVERLAGWRAWTGLPFDRTGEVLVPQGLVPVWCDVERDLGVYVEPNVWVLHELSTVE
ncbi:MAG TPA: N-acetyltransferase [Rugosimonospora sp.]|nr:N-acetyltransferase [Rugosimonospora sp.]